MAELTRPRPAMEPLTQPFWEAASRHVLAVQWCGACGAYQHPPSTKCHRCASRDQLAFRPVSGTGRLVSWTIVHQVLVAGFEGAVPYLNLLVELDEQPGLLLLSDTAAEGLPKWELRQSLRMQVWFEDVTPEWTLPQFRPAEAQ